MVYEKEKVKSIFDFDSIMYGPKIYDVSSFLCSLLFYGSSSSFDDDKIIKKMSLFYKEYKKRSTLSGGEIKGISLLMRVYFVGQILGRVNNLFNEKEIGSLLKGVEWIEKNDKKIKKIFILGN